MSIVKKMLNIDGRILFVIMFIAVAFPLLHPIVLPMVIQPYSQQAYDFANSIPNGSYVLVEGGNIAATDPACGPALSLFVYHMMTKNCKLVFFELTAEGAFWTQKEINVGLGKLPASVPAQNGVNWVNLGYIAGQESGAAALAANIRSTVSKDYFGTSIDTIPMMNNINTAKDFQAAFWFGGSEGSVPYGVRQLVMPYNLPLGASCTTNEAPNYSPYLQAGQLKGLFAGVRGSAEYEFLMGVPGTALGQSMATNIGGLYWLILILLGNILYFISRARGEK